MAGRVTFVKNSEAQDAFLSSKDVADLVRKKAEAIAAVGQAQTGIPWDVKTTQGSGRRARVHANVAITRGVDDAKRAKALRDHALERAVGGAA